MTCERMDLSAYVDGELEEATARAVEEHLIACAACAAEVRDLRALSAALFVPDPPAPRESAVEAAVRAARASVAVHEEEPVRPTVWRTLARLLRLRVSVPAPVLAGALVLLLLVVLRRDRGGEAPGFVRVTVTPARYRSLHEEWKDARALWEDAAVPASFENHGPDAGYRVIYDESVQL